MTRSYRFSQAAAPAFPGAAYGLVLEEHPTPVPGFGQALVRVKAAALNYVDLTVLHGAIPGVEGRTPLLDGAGVVEAVGEGVTRFKPGDRVVANPHLNWLTGEPRPQTSGVVLGIVVDGMLREHAVLPESGLAHLPDSLSFEAGASLPCAGLSAWNSLSGGPTRIATRPGETVLTLGTGGVSLFALQFAKAAGCAVVATSSSPEKLDLLRRLGADAVINYVEQPQWGGEAARLAGGAGVDLAVEVGGPLTLPQSMQAVGVGGRIALIGVVGGMAAMDYSPLLGVCTKMLSVFGNGMGSRTDLEDMLRFVALNQIEPQIDGVHAFEAAPEAIAHFAARRHVGKVVIRI